MELAYTWIVYHCYPEWSEKLFNTDRGRFPHLFALKKYDWVYSCCCWSSFFFHFNFDYKQTTYKLFFEHYLEIFFVKPFLQSQPPFGNPWNGFFSQNLRMWLKFAQNVNKLVSAFHEAFVFKPSKNVILLRAFKSLFHWKAVKWRKPTLIEKAVELEICWNLLDDFYRIENMFD